MSLSLNIMVVKRLLIWYTSEIMLLIKLGFFVIHPSRLVLGVHILLILRAAYNIEALIVLAIRRRLH
jgi:hypothetical protein